LPTHFVCDARKILPAREFGGLRQATRTEIELESIEKFFCHEIDRKKTSRVCGFSVVQSSFSLRCRRDDRQFVIGTAARRGSRQDWSRAGRREAAYLRAAQAYMLISMPTGTSTIFGAFQAI
jgi:hypothetical protein